MPNEAQDSRTAKLIRGKDSLAAARHYASHLPEYRLVSEIPGYMRDMLKRIEDAEEAQRA